MRHPKFKFSVNYHPWDSAPLNLKGYYEPMDTGSRLQMWFLDDGSLAYSYKDSQTAHVSYWGLYDLKKDYIVVYRYDHFLGPLFNIACDTFFIDSDTVIRRLSPSYSWDGYKGPREKKFYRFVPSDTIPADTCPLRKHRWMWEGGVMPQDTL